MVFVEKEVMKNGIQKIETPHNQTTYKQTI